MHTDDIYSRLLAGESSDDIAAEMTKALNEALDRIEEEEKARKEAELKAAQDKAAKEAKEAHNRAKMYAATDIVTDVLTFCATYYPSFGLTLDDNVTDEEIKALASMIIMLLDLEAMKPKRGLRAKANFFEEAKLPVDIELKSEPKKPMTTDEVFAEAFKMLGL